jgi:hypothetical protein
MRRIGRLVGALTASAVLGYAGPASAATLKAEYQLQGTRASAVAGAPDFVDLGPGNQFVTEPVGGVSRQVLAFPSGGGLSLATAGLVDPENFSVVMVFRLASVSGYRRLVDFRGGTSDSGLYVLNGRLVLYGTIDLYEQTPPVAAGSYVQVTVVGGSETDGTHWTEVDLDGYPAVFAEPSDAFKLGTDGLRFFKDNVSGGFGGEESAGALSCVLVYDGVLTPDEVVEHAADPTRCQPLALPPAPSPPPSQPPPSPSPPSSSASPPAPAPAPAPNPTPPFRTGTYVGRTSQGLPMSFTVGTSSAQGIYFRWRARCADGRVRTSGMVLGSTRIRDGRFSVGGLLRTGGRGRVSGSVRGGRASGTLSRWGKTSSGAQCRVSDVTWHAHVVRDPARRS